MKFVCPKMKWEYNKADKTKRRVIIPAQHLPVGG